MSSLGRASPTASRRPTATLSRWARCALLAALLTLAPPAAAAGDGLIEGQLKNGTASGPVPAGLTVVLHIVDEQKRVERRQTTTDEDGRYRFEGLETALGFGYLPVVEYQGALYFPRPLRLAEQPRQTADITVYEATGSDQWIALERSNLLIQDVVPDRLDVMEMGAVANVGDRTYVGPEAPPGAARPTLRFSFPPGARNVTPQAGFAPGELTPTANGYTAASPVVPGRHQLAFSYSLPFGSDRLEITKRLDYPTASFNLYVPDLGLQFESPQLKPQGRADLGGRSFLLYSAQNLTAGTELTIRLGGLPTSGGSLAQRLGPPILGFGCAALLAALFVAFRRRRLTLAGQPIAPAGNGHATSETVELERMRLLLALARLDERYERGELPAEQYRREREAGKRQLVAFGRRQARAEAGDE